MKTSKSATQSFLDALGVSPYPPRIIPFDPGYDPISLEGHLEQSCHLMYFLKVSMACWMIASEDVTRRKIASAKRHNVRTVSGGGPFEIAATYGCLPEYFELCASVGLDRVEAGEGFSECHLSPREVMALADEHELSVQYEIGSKFGGSFTGESVSFYIDKGREWLNAGAAQIVVEARESAQGVGLFDSQGQFNGKLADEITKAFGNDLSILQFEAPNKSSQFSLLDHYGPEVILSNVRLEEILRVEIYRRGLHSQSFGREKLRPRKNKNV